MRGVGNRLMSSPTSATITRAAVTPTPGIWSSRVTTSAKGEISAAILVSSAAMFALIWSMRVSMLDSRNAWWSVK